MNFLPATLIARGPTRRLALKLTTFKKNARIPLEANHIRKFNEAPSGCIDEEEWKRWSCTRLSSPVKYAKSVVWMNASGDRRYRRCKGLRDSFGRVKEENVGDFGLFVAGSEEEELNIEIASRLEKKEGDGDDWLETSSGNRWVVESEENGRGEDGCLTRMTFVRIVLSAARIVPKSVKKKPTGVK